MDDYLDCLEWLLCIRAQIAKAREEAGLQRDDCWPVGTGIGPEDPRQLDLVAIVETVENSKN